MVEFLTLFMWLTTGVHTVELAVTREVATVEILLDGESAGTLDQEPWAFQYDFGDQLRPRELVAVARDAYGRELDRDRRWINLGIRTVDARLDFESDNRGRPTAARIVWESLGTRDPESVEATFDGQPLAVSDPRRLPLPAVDDGELHFLSVRLAFAGEREVRLDAAFGGLFGDQVTTELTAVPVVLEKGTRLPSPHGMAGWFVKDGAALEVQAVEKGEAEVVVVRDPAAQSFFDRMRDTFLSIETGPGRSMDRLGRSRRMGTYPHTLARFRGAMRFPDGTFTSFVSPYPVPLFRDEVTSSTFLGSEPHAAHDQGVLWLSHRIGPASFPPQLSDAVAMAGVIAQSSGHRRAVILVLSGHADDRGLRPVEQVRRYLGYLRVPLFVWSMASESPDPDWGEVTFVGYPPHREGSGANLRHAVRDVGRELGDQRVVWLRGRHLPQTIELSPEVTGLRLAGSRE